MSYRSKTVNIKFSVIQYLERKLRKTLIPQHYSLTLFISA